MYVLITNLMHFFNVFFSEFFITNIPTTTQYNYISHGINIFMYLIVYN